MIKTVQLTRWYDDLCALDRLNLQVQAQETFGLLGPNGAGKTTTIRLLTGLIKPSSGEAYIDGLNVQKQTLDVKARVGLVPERSNLYAELCARDNLVFVARLYGLPRRDALKRADELLELVSLAERSETPFRALSSGMRRRLTIAAALLHRPKVLFLDEPTKGLDVQAARSLRATIRDLKAGGVTIVLTTHMIQEAEQLCDRVAILVEGKLVAVDSPHHLREQCRAETVLEVVAAQPAVFAALVDSPAVTFVSQSGSAVRIGAQSVDVALQLVASVSRSSGIKVEAIRTLLPTLEDAFVQLTGLDAEILQSGAAGANRRHGGKR